MDQSGLVTLRNSWRSFSASCISLVARFELSHLEIPASPLPRAGRCVRSTDCEGSALQELPTSLLAMENMLDALGDVGLACRAPASVVPCLRDAVPLLDAVM